MTSFFLKNLDLAKMLLLSLRGIGRGTHKTSAYFFFASLSMVVFLIDTFFNYKDTHCLKDMFSLLAVSLFYPDLYVADKNPQAANLNSVICSIFLAILFSNGHCLINAANLKKKIF